MIQIRDDVVRAVQSVMERLKTDPSGAIDNEGIRTALLRQASSTPDNIAGSEHVEYLVSPEKRLELKRTFGLKIVGKDALLSDIAYDLEREEVVDLLAARRPELSREEIEAALRVSTLLFRLREKARRRCWVTPANLPWRSARLIRVIDRCAS